MPDFKTFVAAVDTTASAVDVLRLTDRLAQAIPGSPRFAVHAVAPLSPTWRRVLVPYACLGDDEEALRAELEQAAGEAVRSEVSRLWRGVSGAEAVRVATGPAAEAIVSLGSTLGADMLLLGASDAEVMQPGQLGSTAARCMQRTRVPLLLVRRGDGSVPRRIVVGVDLTDESRILVEEALVFAHAVGARVLPVVVVPDGRVADHAGVLPQDGGSGITARVRKEVERRLSQLLSQVDVPFAVSSRAEELMLAPVLAPGDPAETLVARAMEAEADLVVVGRSRPGGAVSRVGRTAEYVARHWPGHVLVVPLHSSAEGS